MRGRLALLAAAILVLAAFLFLWDLPREREQQAQQEAERRLLEFSPATTDTLRITRPTGVVLLARRSDGRWELLEPIQVLADSSAVQKNLALLAEAQRERLLIENPRPDLLEEFGLAGTSSGTVVVEVVFGEGRRDSLFVGSRSPGERGVYVRRNESRAIELADLQVFSVAWIEHHVFRNHDLFAVAESSIVAIDVEAGDVRYSARRGRQELWYLEEPDGRRLKHYMMKNFVYDLATARIREFLWDGLDDDDWKAYGLHAPLADVSFTTADGSAHRIRIGNEDKEQLVFGRRDQENTVFLMPAQILMTAETPLSRLIDHNPIDENFDRLDSLRVTWENGATLAAVRSEREWEPELDEDRLDQVRIPLKNVLYGVERFTAGATMLLARGNDPDDVLDEIPVRCDLHWPHRTVRLRVGWRRGEENHWLHIEGEDQLHAIERDLYFRFRGLLVAAGRLEM